MRIANVNSRRIAADDADDLARTLGARPGPR